MEMSHRPIRGFWTKVASASATGSPASASAGTASGGSAGTGPATSAAATGTAGATVSGRAWKVMTLTLGWPTQGRLAHVPASTTCRSFAPRRIDGGLNSKRAWSSGSTAVGSSSSGELPPLATTREKVAWAPPTTLVGSTPSVIVGALRTVSATWARPKPPASFSERTCTARWRSPAGNPAGRRTDTAQVPLSSGNSGSLSGMHVTQRGSTPRICTRYASMSVLVLVTVTTSSTDWPGPTST